jgi:type II secretory pathway pseudopilin PulG
LICGLAVFAALVAMFFPAIQNAREAARNLACQGNLRELGIATQNYEASNQQLPPGNLGFADAIVFGTGAINRWSDDPNRVLLGDWKYSSIVGFGSKHSMNVNTVLVDGSTQSVSRSVNLQVWYGLCGIADGSLFDNSKF